MPIFPPPASLRALGGFESEQTLAESLVGVADDIRQLATDFGMRPYRVFLVWIGYTADENADGLLDVDEQGISADDRTIGAGRPYLIAELELLPTPRVGPLGGVRQNLEPMGLTESGGLTIDQVSPSYSEDLLLGLLPDVVDPQRPEQLRPGVQFFYEIQEARPGDHQNPGTAGAGIRNCRAPVRRKFVVDGTPYRQTDAFQWIVDLMRADGERGRNGEVAEVLPP